MPSEYVLTRSLARSRRPTSSSTSSTRGCGTPPASASSDSVSRAEKCAKNCGLSTIAPTWPTTSGSAAGTSWPSSAHAGRRSARIRPSSVRSVVVLPEPFGPEEAVHLAGLDHHVEAVQRLPRAAPHATRYVFRRPDISSTAATVDLPVINADVAASPYAVHATSREGQAQMTLTPGVAERLERLGGRPESVTSVSTRSIGQIRANACPPSFDESAMMTTRLARATIRLFIAASPSWWAAAPSVHVERVHAEQRHVEGDLAQDAAAERADQLERLRAHHAAGHHDLHPGADEQLVGDVERVGDHGELGAVARWCSGRGGRPAPGPPRSSWCRR